MKIVFTKGSGKYDMMEIIRDGMIPERVQCPKQRIIPHDMVHFAVEQALRIRGFLGRVKDGERAGFQMHPEAESDSVERLVEVVQADEWSGRTSSAAAMMEMYRVTCAARACAALPLDKSAVEAVRAALVDLSIRWEAVPIGGSMRLEF